MSYLVAPSLCRKPWATTCSWFSEAHSYYSVQVWLIFTLWVPVWCIRISKPLMFLWMKTSLLRWQMLDSATFWGELTLQAPLLKCQQMKYSLHQSNIYLYISISHESFVLSGFSCTHTIMPCRVREFRRFSEKSDVYSFGVFLLELLSGKEATASPFPDSNQNLVEWVKFNLYEQSL